MDLIKYFQLHAEPVQMMYRHRTMAFWDIYHAHQGMEFIYVHEGQGRVIIDQSIHELKPHTLMLFQPYQLHRVQLDTRKSSNYERSKFIFEPSLIDNTLSMLPKLQSFFRSLWKDTLTHQVLYLPELALDWESLLKQLDEAIRTTSKDEHVEHFTLFLIAFLQGLRAHWPRHQASAASLPRPSHHVEHIMQWLDEHYHESFQLEALAQSLHLTGSHVSHLFSKYTGASITDYLTAKRLREACWLLRTSSEPVHLICAAVGLSNVSYFCQLFKTHIGLSPHQYRKNSPRPSDSR